MDDVFEWLDRLGVKEAGEAGTESALKPGLLGPEGQEGGSAFGEERATGGRKGQELGCKQMR